MTVAELIVELQKCRQSAPVTVTDQHGESREIWYATWEGNRVALETKGA